MASNQTEHLGLNLWEGTDNFVRAEFNEDNHKIDSTLTAHETALAQKVEAVIGEYIGNGAQSRAIDLGFRPIAVHLECNTGRRDFNATLGGLLTGEFLSDSGFVVKSISALSLNDPNARYIYIAYRNAFP